MSASWVGRCRPCARGQFDIAVHQNGAFLEPLAVVSLKDVQIGCGIDTTTMLPGAPVVSFTISHQGDRRQELR
jgi:hypothetical protein